MKKELIIGIVVVFVVIFVLEIYLKARIRKTLTTSLINDDLAAFDSIRNNRFTMLLLPKNDLFYYDLQKAVALKDDQLIDKTIRRLESLKLTDSQKKTIYSTAFYHYLSLEDAVHIEPYYQKLSELKGGDGITEEDVLYDVYAKKGHKYLDYVLDLYEKAAIDKKASLELLLARIYENLADKKKADEYFKKAKQRLNNQTNA